jgi:hypothetical protein
MSINTDLGHWARIFIAWALCGLLTGVIIDLAFDWYIIPLIPFTCFIIQSWNYLLTQLMLNNTVDVSCSWKMPGMKPSLKYLSYRMWGTVAFRLMIIHLLPVRRRLDSSIGACDVKIVRAVTAQLHFWHNGFCGNNYDCRTTKCLGLAVNPMPIIPIRMLSVLRAIRMSVCERWWV